MAIQSFFPDSGLLSSLFTPLFVEPFYGVFPPGSSVISDLLPEYGYSGVAHILSANYDGGYVFTNNSVDICAGNLLLRFNDSLELNHSGIYFAMYYTHSGSAKFTVRSTNLYCYSGTTNLGLVASYSPQFEFPQKYSTVVGEGMRLYSNSFQNSLISGMVGNPNLKFELQSTLRTNPSGSFETKIESAFVYVEGNGLENLTIPMYISGPEQSSGNLSLYINSIQPSGEATLYIQGHDTVDTGSILYVAGGVTASSGLDLYINSDIHKGLDLFIRGNGGPTSGNLSLFCKSEEVPIASTKQTTFYISNYEQNSSGIPLYIGGPSIDEIVKNIPLYVAGFNGNSTGSVNLYINSEYFNSGEINYPTTLFLENKHANSGNITLYISGPGSGEFEKGITLFAKVKSAISGGVGIPLYMRNTKDSGDAAFPLFVSNQINNSGNTTLYIGAGGTDYRSGTLPLVLHNVNPIDGGIPLNIIAGAFVNDTTLFVQGNDYNFSGTLPLYMYSSANSGLEIHSTLFTSGNYGTSNSTPLFISAVGDSESSDRITLYLQNSTDRNLSMPLYIYSSGDLTNKTVRLFISGEGLYEGSYVNRSGIPLFIQRSVDSTMGAVQLFLSSTEGLISGLTTFISGGTYVTSSLDLVMASSIAPVSENLKLYTHGF